MKPEERILMLAVADGMQPMLYSPLLLPQKRIMRMLEKWVRKGWWDYGVSLRTGWLTDEGKAAAEEIRKQV